MNAREWVESTEANAPLTPDSVTRHCPLHGPYESVRYSQCPSCRALDAMPREPESR